MRAQLGPVGKRIAELPPDDPSLEGIGDVQVPVGWAAAALVVWHLLVFGVFLLGVRFGAGGG